MPENGIRHKSDKSCREIPLDERSQGLGAMLPKAKAWRHLAAIAAGVVKEEETRLG